MTGLRKETEEWTYKPTDVGEAGRYQPALQRCVGIESIIATAIGDCARCRDDDRDDGKQAQFRNVDDENASEKVQHAHRRENGPALLVVDRLSSRRHDDTAVVRWTTKMIFVKERARGKARSEVK